MRLRNYVLTVVYSGCFALLSAPHCPAQEPDAVQATAAEASSPEQRIQNALRRPVSAEFQEVPLEDVIAILQNEANIEIVIDTRSLDDVGVTLDVPISCDFSPQKRLLCLRSVLNHILEQYDLTWTIRHETLTVTTPEEAENCARLTVFPVSDLIVVADEKLGASYDYQWLVEVITTVIEPDTWDNVGGAGTITPVFGALAITQTQQVNDEIAELLAAIRQLKAISQEQTDHPVSSSILVEDGHNATARAALRTRVTLDIVESPLSDVALFLSNVCKVPILLDHRALDDVGVPGDSPVTSHLTDLSLQMALTRALYPLDLTWHIRDEAIVITTKVVYENALDVRVYPVIDLVEGKDQRPIDSGLDELIEVVTSNIAPDSWDEVGGPGTVEPLTRPAALVISHTPDVHSLIDDLFAKLRVARDHERKNSPVADQPYRPVPTRMIYRLTTPENGQSVLAERLVTLIPKVLQDGWRQGDDVLLECLGGALIVQHDQATQLRVQRLLSELGVWSGSTMGGGGMGGGAMGGGAMGGGGGGMFRVDLPR